MCSTLVLPIFKSGKFFLANPVENFALEYLYKAHCSAPEPSKIYKFIVLLSKHAQFALEDHYLWSVLLKITAIFFSRFLRLRVE